MVMCDYFSATGDEEAVGVLDEPGGPDPAVFDVLPLKGIDPVVVMARLEAIVTGRDHDEASARPRSGELLSDPGHGSAFVVSVSDSLRRALASASDERLAEAAMSWADSEELRDGPTSADDLLAALRLLAGLARRADRENRRLYCWWAL
ncbi:hypothetical protein KIK06_13345 [Nocardiopsis sp. EMB25]|uniref:hypothetical protein n=1 Tax=Nocardiopsis TaxID=2013 RepID=UPI000348DB25|nr:MULTISPECIES: hypothetical protein [Nocardiopsis]MCY9784876.1 hypothetical protein [Nocardiopsis sp. EMB25]